ncbi:MAG TPA: hypothetical protein PLZ79_06420 [Burkholderiales bacterium]|nr:hypothetical protein [Burkholderiales bacterium]
MARVSFQQSPKTTSVVKVLPAATNAAYVASRDYGTRSAEIDKHFVQFGRRKATIYKRSDVANSSWYFRFFVREEKRHYRKSLQTVDRVEAVERATAEIVNVLAKVQSGERILARSLRDLARMFREHLESQVTSGDIAQRTLEVQRYRIELGCEFLKEKLPAGLDTKISAIDGKIFGDYLPWRLDKAAMGKRGTIRKDVVRDELLVIRKMFKHGRKQRLCTDRAIPQWDFKVEKVPPARRRLKDGDYSEVVTLMRSWVREARDDKDAYHRKLVQHVMLVAANCGMRSGEIFGLKNGDIEIRRAASECKITVRPETSKVRKGRTVMLFASSGGRSTTRTTPINYLIRWVDECQLHKEPEDFVFAPYQKLHPRTKQRVSPRDVYYHTYKSLRAKLAERNLEWFDTYHGRHLWITARLLAGESIHLVAATAGTSVREIEATYSHVIGEVVARQFNERRENARIGIAQPTRASGTDHSQ